MSFGFQYTNRGKVCRPYICPEEGIAGHSCGSVPSVEVQFAGPFTGCVPSVVEEEVAGNITGSAPNVEEEFAGPFSSSVPSVEVEFAGPITGCVPSMCWSYYWQCSQRGGRVCWSYYWLCSQRVLVLLLAVFPAWR